MARGPAVARGLVAEPAIAPPLLAYIGGPLSMENPAFEIYAGQCCRKCGADLERMGVISFDEGSLGSYLLTGACANCRTYNKNVLAKKIS